MSFLIWGITSNLVEKGMVINMGANKEKTYHQSFFYGAIILSLAMIAVKLAGALFKIPLAHIITENGIGYFGTAYNFYGVIFSLASAGFPVAISKMVAESYSLGKFKDVRLIKKVSLPIFIVTGLVGTFAIILFSQPYTNSIGNPRAYISVIALAPSVFFCCLSSVYRGYFEGLRNMVPTAVSQVTEALSKLCIGLLAAFFTAQYLSEEYTMFQTVLGENLPGEEALLQIYSFASAAAILGVSFGSLLSFVFLFVYSKIKGDGINEGMLKTAPNSATAGQITKKLLRIAIPVGLGSLAMSLASLIDTVVINRRLVDIIEYNLQSLLNFYGNVISPENSGINILPNYLYGCYNNAHTIYMLVPSLTIAFGVSALPNLTNVWAKRNKESFKSNGETVLRITSVVTFPAGLGLAFFSEPISYFLFGSSEGSFIASKVLFVLGIAAIFSGLNGAIASMLQAVGRADLPVKLLVLALTVKCVLSYLLCGVTEINILGAAIGTLALYALLNILEIFFLTKVTGIKFSLYSVFTKPLFSAILSVLLGKLCYQLAISFLPSTTIVLFISIIITAFFYIILLFIFKTFKKEDILLLPKGDKIVKVLEKNHWIG